MNISVNDDSAQPRAEIGYVCCIRHLVSNDHVLLSRSSPLSPRRWQYPSFRLMNLHHGLWLRFQSPLNKHHQRNLGIKTVLTAAPKVYAVKITSQLYKDFCAYKYANLTG